MKIVAAVAIGLMVFFAYQFVDHLPGGEHPLIAGQPSVEEGFIPAGGHYDMSAVDATVEGDRIMVPLRVVEERKIVAFDYTDGTATIPLLAFVSSEGKLVTAFRFCEPCNSKKYAIDGDRLSCGNCETQWSLRNLDGLQGNCQKYPPDPIRSTVRDGMIVIDLRDVRNWKTRL